MGGCSLNHAMLMDMFGNDKTRDIFSDCFHAIKCTFSGGQASSFPAVLFVTGKYLPFYEGF